MNSCKSFRLFWNSCWTMAWFLVFPCSLKQYAYLLTCPESDEKIDNPVRHDRINLLISLWARKQNVYLGTSNNKKIPENVFKAYLTPMFSSYTLSCLGIVLELETIVRTSHQSLTSLPLERFDGWTCLFKASLQELLMERRATALNVTFVLIFLHSVCYHLLHAMSLLCPCSLKVNSPQQNHRLATVWIRGPLITILSSESRRRPLTCGKCLDGYQRASRCVGGLCWVC